MFSTAETPPGFPLSWAYAIDDAGRPIENPEARYEGTTGVIRPGAFGAHNWHPMSYSPQTGLVYIPVQELALDYTRDPTYQVLEGRWNLGVVQAPFPEDEPTRAAMTFGCSVRWSPMYRPFVGISFRSALASNTKHSWSWPIRPIQENALSSPY